MRLQIAYFDFEIVLGVNCSCLDVSSASSSSDDGFWIFALARIKTMNQEKQMIENFVENVQVNATKRQWH